MKCQELTKAQFEAMDLRPKPKTKKQIEDGLKKIKARQEAFRKNVGSQTC